MARRIQISSTGEVSTNRQAFEQVRARLKNDVGFIFAAAHQSGVTPNWALSRTLFPVAESLAGLLFPKEASTAKRLVMLFDRELCLLDPRYKEFSGIITLMWRHGLTHADEPPALRMGYTKIVTWLLSVSEKNEGRDHLQTLRNVVDGLDEVMYGFNLWDFYNDLLRLCETLIERQFRGSKPKKVYNSWFVKKLPVRVIRSGSQRRRRLPLTYVERLAQTQFKALFK